VTFFIKTFSSGAASAIPEHPSENVDQLTLKLIKIDGSFGSCKFQASGKLKRYPRPPQPAIHHTPNGYCGNMQNSEEKKLRVPSYSAKFATGGVFSNYPTGKRSTKPSFPSTSPLEFTLHKTEQARLAHVAPTRT
jgi:hypothetical protein